MARFILKKCPDCDGRGYVLTEDEVGRELGMFTCPTCKHSPKPGYILERIGEEDPVVVDSLGVKHYLKDLK